MTRSLEFVQVVPDSMPERKAQALATAIMAAGYGVQVRYQGKRSGEDFFTVWRTVSK